MTSFDSEITRKQYELQARGIEPVSLYIGQQEAEEMKDLFRNTRMFQMTDAERDELGGRSKYRAFDVYVVDAPSHVALS